VRRVTALGAVALAILAGCSSTTAVSPSTTSTLRPTTSSTSTTSSTPTTTAPAVPGASLGPHVGALALVADVGAAGMPELVADPAAVADLAGAIVPTLTDAARDQPAYYPAGCHAGVDAVAPLPQCVLGAADGTVDVAVVGDSKAGQWVDALELIAAVSGWRVHLYTKSGCPVTDYMVRVRPPDGVVRDYVECREFAAATVAALTAPGQVPDLVLFSQGQSGRTATGDPDPAMADAVAHTWSALIGAGARVVALADVPTPTKPVADVPRCIAAHPDDYAACRFPRNAGGGTPALLAAAREVPEVTFVDMGDWVCPMPAGCPTVVGGVLVYRQSSHLTRTFVRSLAPILQRALVAAGAVDGPEMPLAPVGSVGS